VLRRLAVSPLIVIPAKAGTQALGL